MLFLRAAALGMLVTIIGWSVVHPSYWKLSGPDLVRSNSDYDVPARDLLAGRGSNPVVPPAFPMLLAALVKACDGRAVSAGSAYAMVVLLCVGLTSGSIAALWPGSHARHALWGAVFWAANPLAFWFSTYVSPETIFLPCSLAAVAAMLRAARPHATRRYTWAALSGAAAGAAMLTRPIGVGLPVVLAAVLVWNGWAAMRKAAVAQGAVIIVAAVLVTMPWEIRMYNLTGRVLPLSVNGPASVIDGLSYASNPEMGRVPIRTSAASRRAQDWWFAHRAEFLDGRRSVASGIAERVREDPRSMLALLAEKAAWSWYATYQGSRMTTLLFLQLVSIAGMVIASRRAWVAQASPRAEPIRLLVVTGWAVVAYSWCMTIMALSIARYMIPATAPLYGLAGFLFVRGRFQSREP